jgi:hypothetical protein
VRSVAAARSLCWLARYLGKFGLFLNTPRIMCGLYIMGASVHSQARKAVPNACYTPNPQQAHHRYHASIMQERTTNHTDPHHTIFSSFMSLPFSPLQIFPTAPHGTNTKFHPLPKQPAILQHCIMYSDFSNSSDNYDVGKQILKLNGTNIIGRDLSVLPPTPVYVEVSFTVQRASQVLNL